MASPGTLFGRAIAYDTPTTIRTPAGEFDEMVASGALSDLIRSGGHKATTIVREHAPGMLLGRVQSGTLELVDGTGGLDIRNSLPDTELGRETAELVARGDLDGMSFAFTIGGQRWHDPKDPGDRPTRVITRITRLYDVSVVTWPAYTTTRVRVQRGKAGARAADHTRYDRHRDLSARMLEVQHDHLAHRMGSTPARRPLSRRQDRLAAAMRLGPLSCTPSPQERWCQEHRLIVRVEP